MLSTLLNLLSDLCINHWKTLQSQNGKISIFSIESGNTVPTVTVAVSGLNIHPIRNRIIPHQLRAGSHRQHADKKWWREEMDI